MEQYRLEPFDLDRAIAGEKLSYNDHEVLEFSHYDGIPDGNNCIVILIIREHGMELRTLTKHEASLLLQIKTPIKSHHPFDADKLAEGWIVKTCDGREVKQVTVFNVDSLYTVYGVLNGIVERWTPNGAYSYLNPDAHILDLVMYTPE